MADRVRMFFVPLGSASLHPCIPAPLLLCYLSTSSNGLGAIGVSGSGGFGELAWEQNKKPPRGEAWTADCEMLLLAWGSRSLLIIVDHLRRWFARFKLCAHFLDLRCLFVETFSKLRYRYAEVFL
jgi:hypothetical protein